MSLFVPGHEWQDVPTGAVIAPGCQIEADMTDTSKQRARRNPDPDLIPRIDSCAHLAPLCAQQRWVLWDYERRGDKLTKVPKQPNGRNAKSNDPATWSSYAAVKAAFLRGVTIKQGKGAFDGVGYVLGSDDDIVGTDCDDCLGSMRSSFPSAPEGSSIRSTATPRSPPAARGCAPSR